MIEIKNLTNGSPLITNEWTLTLLQYTTGWTTIISGPKDSYHKYQHSYINMDAMDIGEQISIKTFKLCEVILSFSSFAFVTAELINFCPPKPGLTDIRSTKSTSLKKSFKTSL